MQGSAGKVRPWADKHGYDCIVLRKRGCRFIHLAADADGGLGKIERIDGRYDIYRPVMLKLKEAIVLQGG